MCLASAWSSVAAHGWVRRPLVAGPCPSPRHDCPILGTGWQSLPPAHGCRGELNPPPENETCRLSLMASTSHLTRNASGIPAARSCFVTKPGFRWSGWLIRGWFEWLVAVLSCAIFLLLEGGLLYSYYQFLKNGQW